MAKAGAHIIGVNCNFDPSTHLETISLMKTALDEVGLKPYLMVQPNGFKVPDAGIFGWINIPEFPYGEIFTISCFLSNLIYFRPDCDVASVVQAGVAGSEACGE